MIEDNIVRVSRFEAMSQLKLKLNGYRYNWGQVYIGVTATPESRWAKHVRNGWHKMVLLYEAIRPDIARALEKMLIAYAHECNFRIAVENVNPGGEGLTDEIRNNYLYILVRDRVSRLTDRGEV